jgi:hypothetical protein
LNRIGVYIGGERARGLRNTEEFMIAASVDGFRSANDVITISEADQEDLRFPFARTQELRVGDF